MSRYVESAGGKSPVGVNEVLAVGLGAVALLRIRRRRQKAAAERDMAERAKRAEEGNSGKPSPSAG
ncbi:MAG: hypothetical protein JWO59_285 [Chloroflexi bacterium]|nr:hypothetical protein [Chloroflexota bacterium]MDB5073845.1 hypothetical protein [Chloroflexota bacterium]